MSFIKSRDEKDYENKMVALLVELEHVYGNKSSDEYKMCGDITKSKAYGAIENMIANLSTLKGINKNDVTNLKSMFNALHRPIYKKMVTEYLNGPNDRNSLFTCIFTCGYRVLVGELSRIFASTVATDKGLIYKPDKISKSESAAKFIVAFNKDMDKKVDEYIRKNNTSAKIKQEAYVVQEGIIGNAVGAVAAFITNHEILALFPALTDLCDFIFGPRSELNPISFMHFLLSTHYDKKVAKFQKAEAMYEETKKAYEEYMRIPAVDRKKKIESKYVNMMKKYNIQMENLRAELKHYDSRAMADVKEKANSTKRTTTSKPSTTTGDTTGDTAGDNKPGEDVNTPTNDSDDLDW